MEGTPEGQVRRGPARAGGRRVFGVVASRGLAVATWTVVAARSAANNKCLEVNPAEVVASCSNGDEMRRDRDASGRDCALVRHD